MLEPIDESSGFFGVRITPKDGEPFVKKAKRRIVFGLIWFLGGLFFTLLGFAVVEQGEKFYIFIGAIGLGLFLLIKGGIDKARLSVN